MFRILPDEHKLSFIKNPFLIIDEDEFNVLEVQSKVEFPARHRQHFLKALRHREGQVFWVGDGRGRLTQTIFDKECLYSDGRVFCSEPIAQLEILQANIKPKYLEYCIQKCSELAVRKITVFQGELSQDYAVKASRLQEISLMASMQAKSIFQTEIAIVEKKIDQIEFAKNKNIYFGDFFSENKHFHKTDKNNNCIFINGPEGGWSAREQDFLKKGFLGIKLCDNVLRSDTAAVFAAALYAHLS